MSKHYSVAIHYKYDDVLSIDTMTAVMLAPEGTVCQAMDNVLSWLLSATVSAKHSQHDQAHFMSISPGCKQLLFAAEGSHLD